MARPSAPLLLSQLDETGTEWQVLAADSYYAITYKGQLVNIRTFNHSTILNPPKYKKTGYTNLGNCQATVRKLNEIFMTEDFGYIAIGEQDENALG